MGRNTHVENVIHTLEEKNLGHGGFIHGKSDGTQRESCGARLCKARLMHKDMKRPTAERPQTAALLFYFLLFSMKQQKFWPSALQVRPPARPWRTRSRRSLQMAGNMWRGGLQLYDGDPLTKLRRIDRRALQKPLQYGKLVCLCLQVFTPTGPLDRARQQSHAGPEDEFRGR